VRHEQAIDTESPVHERLLGGGSMHEQNVRVALLPHRQRLPGADRDGLHHVAGRLLERRDQLVKQARILS